MLELMELGVNGIISDRPDLLLQAAQEFDANKDGVPGDFIGPDSLIDITQLDAQGHRGGRNLRPENTLPAMEVALDSLMTTLETDTGITKNGIPVLDHDPHVEAAKCRRADGAPYELANQSLVKDLTLIELQSSFICDKIIRDPTFQKNDLALSPVSVAFATLHGIMHPYVMPTVQQLFDFVEFYEEYYKTGAGSSHPQAVLRAQNVAKVRFNIETKINPRAEFSARTVGPEEFARALANVIVANGIEERADIQSFDFRTLLRVQRKYPAIRTVYLFGDFPIYPNDPANPNSGDGTNLQDESEANTPWLAGLHWPYRVTRLDHPFRAQRSGGFEGMALSTDDETLLPLLEKPLSDGESDTLLIHPFDLAAKHYTGIRYKYPFDPRGRAIGDFAMYSEDHGLVIERDDTQGDLNGFKAVFDIKLEPIVQKDLLIDLLDIHDPNGISLAGSQPGDLGIGSRFAFPFVTIEDIVVFDHKHIGVLNDNNFPFSVGRHVGTGMPDDNEFIIIKLDKPLKEVESARPLNPHRGAGCVHQTEIIF